MSMGYENAIIWWARAHQIQRTSERRSTEQWDSLALVGNVVAHFEMTEAYIHFERSFNRNSDSAPFTISDIKKLETELEIKLPTDYGMFLMEHGNLYTPDILDLLDDKQLDMADIQNIWTVDRILHDKANEWTSNLEVELIPFASDSMDNIFAFKRSDILERKMNAPVYFYDHDFDTIENICDSFKALIERYNGLKD